MAIVRPFIGGLAMVLFSSIRAAVRSVHSRQAIDSAGFHPKRNSLKVPRQVIGYQFSPYKAASLPGYFKPKALDAF